MCSTVQLCVLMCSECISFIAIPYSNDSKRIRHGWLVSSCSDVPTENAKSLIPIILRLGSIAMGENRGERRIGDAR